jgi:hypothetical protein
MVSLLFKQTIFVIYSNTKIKYDFSNNNFIITFRVTVTGTNCHAKSEAFPTLKHNAMKTCGDVAVKFNTFLTFMLRPQ